MSGETEKPVDDARPVPHQPVAWPLASRRARIWAGAVIVGCAAVLGVAIKLQPDSRGYGTHQQLGAAPCGMIVRTGLPCPTCGMTTAFAYTVRGNWWAAFRSQPAGFILALTTIATVVISLRVVMTGRWPRALLNDRFVFRLFIALLVLLVAGWGFKLLSGFLDHSLPIRMTRL